MAAASAEGRLAHRLVSVPFLAGASYSLAVFGAGLGRRQIRSGVLLAGMLYGAAALGLWRRRRWGRSLGLLLALANAGVGVLSLLSVIVLGSGSPARPAALLVVNAALAGVLGSRRFDPYRDT